jgi:hypothetical protein
MKKKIRKLAKKAGFVIWGDASWGPGKGHVDWSCNYDEELVKYTDLVIQMCADHIMESSDRYRKEYFAQKLMELKNGNFSI